MTRVVRKDDLDAITNRTAGDGPLTRVARARATARRADEELHAAVELARKAGRTWQEIGEVLGTTRQAAFQRFGRPIDPRMGVPATPAMVPGAADRARGVLDEVIAQHWPQARQDFAPELAERLDADRLAKAWARVTGMVGSYTSSGEPVTRQLGDYTVVDVPMCFTAGRLTGRVSFAATGRVAGLFFVKPNTP